nr:MULTISPECIES: methyltransferase domain-containing protein [unclassified Mycolicibacterium]
MRGRHGDPQPRVQGVVDQLLAGKDRPRVLEAGCGSLSRVKLPKSRMLVGIDIEQRQLDRNTSLDEKILGDLQTMDTPAPGYDLVLCWDVIEHLPSPMNALERMTAALNPGGGLVLAFPHLWSLKGLLTKFTPYFVHALFYRYIVGDKRSSDEWDQFPTFFRAGIAPARLRAWAAQHDLEVAYDEIYEGPVQTALRSRGLLLDKSFAALGMVSRVLSLGRLDLGLSDCVLVLRRPSVAVADLV